MGQKTEEHIKQVAKRLFFKEGRFDVRLHEIAKTAEVNKALLHYYFRDRENLLQVVYKEAMEGSFLKMFELLSGNEKFEKKVTNAVEHITSYLAEFPFIETFIVGQVNAAGEKTEGVLPVKAAREFTKKFGPEAKSYMLRNKIRGVTPEEFIVNMMALCAYPSSMKPVIQGILNYSEKEFSRFLEQRKKNLVKMVLMKE
jgi:TetR/AcrR family transcriptional regulator